jgi:general secretion pathway protein L
MADGDVSRGESAMTKDGSIGRARRFYWWWLRELSKIITPRRAGERPWRTLLFNTTEGLEIYTRGAGPTRRIGILDPHASADQIASLRRLLLQRETQNSKQVLLRLSPADVVHRTIQIPVAASDLMDSVVENKIETIVPWPQDNTCYGYRAKGENATTPDQIDTDIVATTKTIVDAAVERARRIGLSPNAIDFAPTADAPSTAELMTLEADPVSKTAGRLHIAILALVLAGFAVGGFGFYQVWGLKTQYGDLESKITAIMARVDDVKRLNDENTKLREQRERLAKLKIDDRPVMVLIEALRRALPDTAYLDEFEIHEKEARLVGKSADPTSLIETLESTPEFEDVRFSAPTTREDGQKLGTFSIVGRVQEEAHAEKTQ